MISSKNGKYIAKYCASCSDKQIFVYDVGRVPEVESLSSEDFTPAPEKKDKFAQLRELKALLDEGVLTQEEFDSEKKKILDGEN